MNSQFCYDMVTLKMGTRFATAQFLSSKWFCCLRKRQNAIKTISLQLNGVTLANTYNYQLSDKVAHNGNLLPSAYTNIHIDYLYSGSNQNLVCLQQKFFHKLWSSCCRTVIQRQNDRSALQSECNQLSGVSLCWQSVFANLQHFESDCSRSCSVVCRQIALCSKEVTQKLRVPHALTATKISAITRQYFQVSRRMPSCLFPSVTE